MCECPASTRSDHSCCLHCVGFNQGPASPSNTRTQRGIWSTHTRPALRRTANHAHPRVTMARAKHGTSRTPAGAQPLVTQSHPAAATPTVPPSHFRCKARNQGGVYRPRPPPQDPHATQQHGGGPYPAPPWGCYYRTQVARASAVVRLQAAPTATTPPVHASSAHSSHTTSTCRCRVLAGPKGQGP